MTTPYHPLFVHFPIALYFLGVLMTMGYLWRKEPEYERFAFWAFFLSWVGAVVASLVGLVDKGQLAYDDPRQNELNNHITAGVFFIVIAGLVVYSRFRWQNILNSSNRWWYLTLIWGGIVVVVVTGWLGGELVYELHIGIR